MKHQLKQIFHSPKFLMGFVLFMIMLLAAIFYPLFSAYGPLQMVATGFQGPGTYVSLPDAIDMETVTIKLDTTEGRIKSLLTEEMRTQMKDWLVNYGGVPEGDIDTGDTMALVALWNANYDSTNPQKGLLAAEKKAYIRLNTTI